MTPRKTLADLVAAYVRARPGQHWNLVAVSRSLGDVAHVRTSDVERYKFARELDGISPATVRRELGALRSCLAWGVKSGRYPAGAVPFFDLPPPSQPRDMFLDEDQEREFLALAMDHSRDRVLLSRVTRFVWVALNTGARKSAIEGLTWDRVSLRDRTIDFREPGKVVSRKRRVLVPINDRLFPVLERANHEKTTLFVVDPGSINKAYRRTWLPTTPYPWATPHILRHTYITLMARAGVDLSEIAELVGDDAATVLKHYRHHSKGRLVSAANARFRPVGQA
jgi:integrase